MSLDKKTGHWIYSDYSGIKKIDEHDKNLQLKINQEVDGVMPGGLKLEVRHKPPN